MDKKLTYDFLLDFYKRAIAAKKRKYASLKIRKPEYEAYKDMKKRCLNPKHKGYKNYGGRGISVCERWLESFDNFKADMGNRPPGKSLDRIDNSGNYEPSNCRWATAKEQIANRRVCKYSSREAKRKAGI